LFFCLFYFICLFIYLFIFFFWTAHSFVPARSFRGISRFSRIGDAPARARDIIVPVRISVHIYVREITILSSSPLQDRSGIIEKSLKKKSFFFYSRRQGTAGLERRAPVSNAHTVKTDTPQRERHLSTF